MAVLKKGRARQGRCKSDVWERKWSDAAHPLSLYLQRVAVAGFLPVVDRVLGMVAPAAEMPTDEADPYVAGTAAHLLNTHHCLRSNITLRRTLTTGAHQPKDTCTLIIVLMNVIQEASCSHTGSHAKKLDSICKAAVLLLDTASLFSAPKPEFARANLAVRLRGAGLVAVPADRAGGVAPAFEALVVELVVAHLRRRGMHGRQFQSR